MLVSGTNYDGRTPHGHLVFQDFNMLTDAISTTRPTINDPDGKATVEIELDTLLETRLFIQANSGGGKSMLLRRIFEQTAGTVQQLMIDPEGEFHTLRECHELAYCAPRRGDGVATPDTAHLLARRLLELGSSAVIDINDLSPPDRLVFVTKFLTSLMTAPRALWHQVMIGIDEVQKFAPQDADTTAKRDCAAAVIDLAGQGRKRGYCAVIASQRIATVNKSVISEINNFAIGRTGLDVDITRARGVIGLSSKDATATLPHLAPGEFFVVGPALTPVVTRVRTGHVETTHPRSGQRRAPPAPTPDRVRAKLGPLADLKAAAATDESDPDVLKARIRELELAVTNHEATIHALRSDASIQVNAAEIERLRNDNAVYRKQLEDAEKENEVLSETVEEMTTTLDPAISDLITVVDTVRSVSAGLLELRNKFTNDLQAQVENELSDGGGETGSGQTGPHETQQGATTPGQTVRSAAGNVAESHVTPGRIPRSEGPPSSTSMPAMYRAILTALAQRGPLPKNKILIFAGYASSGKVSSAFADLGRRGWILPSVSMPNCIGITEAGRKALGPVKPLPRGQALREQVAAGLDTMPRKIFEVVCAQYPRGIAKGEALKLAGYAPSGKVSSAFAYLVAREWLKQDGPGRLVAATELFE